eukprot:symbB.v1.2.031987.t1/scaffold3776.1/size50502/2
MVLTREVIFCLGTDLIGQEVWTVAREVDKALQLTHVPKDYILALANTFFGIERTGALPGAIADCALGVAVLAVNALPQAELRWGTGKARHYYFLYAEIMSLFAQYRNFSGFQWNLDSHQSAGYPLILGLHKPSCFGYDLKIFVYETDFAQKPVMCSQGMFADEVFVHKFLQQSACRTEFPEEADVFFVPMYASCVMSKENIFAKEMDSIYTTLVREKLPYLESRGKDHVFLWSSETYAFPSWSKYIADSMFLSVEAVPIECTDYDALWNYTEENAEAFQQNCRHCHECFAFSKDYVIPGFVEKWSIEKMKYHEKPHAERSYTACYHGADSDAMAIYHYANATVRNALQTLKGRANFSIGYRFKRVTDYFERIGDCHFCFAPKGVGYWSNRLYEVLFAGCIPVILSDHIGLPFMDFLDWESFSLMWPMWEVGPTLADRLEQLLLENDDLVRSMHEAVLKNRCWFDYNSYDSNCSPYVGILRYLHGKKLQATKLPPGQAHWGVMRLDDFLA